MPLRLLTGTPMSYLLVFFILAAMIALVDILPLYYRRRPWRYCATVFVEAAVICLVIFYAEVGGLAWWIEGPAVGILLSLPALLRPTPRGAYRWYSALGNAAVVGLAAAGIEAKLPGLATWFT